MKNYKLRGKKSVMAMNKNMIIKANKQGSKWKGIIVKRYPIQEHILINYTNGTLECELHAYMWDKTTIE